MATGPNQENQNKRAAQDEADQYVRFGSLMGELPAQTIRQLAANEQKDVVASLDGEDLDARYKEVVPRTDEELYAEFNQLLGVRAKKPSLSATVMKAAPASTPKPSSFQATELESTGFMGNMRQSKALQKAKSNLGPSPDPLASIPGAAPTPKHPDFRRNVQELLTKNRRRSEHGTGKYTDETEDGTRASAKVERLKLVRDRPDASAVKNHLGDEAETGDFTHRQLAYSDLPSKPERPSLEKILEFKNAVQGGERDEKRAREIKQNQEKKKKKQRQTKAKKTEQQPQPPQSPQQQQPISQSVPSAPTPNQSQNKRPNQDQNQNQVRPNSRGPIRRNKTSNRQTQTPAPEKAKPRPSPVSGDQRRSAGMPTTKSPSSPSTAGDARPRPANKARTKQIAVGAVVTGVVIASSPAGVVLRGPGGITGLLPLSGMSDRRQAEMKAYLSAAPDAPAASDGHDALRIWAARQMERQLKAMEGKDVTCVVEAIDNSGSLFFVEP
jgi:hypothetical protein